MSKLQNNFTTVGQSKMLLEIGLPANSADSYYENFCSDDPDYIRLEIRQNIKEVKNNLFEDYTRLLPCWSVGRLMEIVDICSVKQNYVGKFEFEMNKSYIQNLIYLIIGMLHAKDLDFSKLEE